VVEQYLHLGPAPVRSEYFILLTRFHAAICICKTSAEISESQHVKHSRVTFLTRFSKVKKWNVYSY